jgi:hypothetical protein
MDAAVLAALAKWPQVPACYDWLHLDARGQWRLGQHGGEPVRHAGLAAFISRNYAADARGAWYCQNGPQRAYVALERAPWVVRVTGAGDFVTHTGLTIEPESVWFDEDATVYLSAGTVFGSLDDRDLADVLTRLCRANGKPIEDAHLADALAELPTNESRTLPFCLRHQARQLPAWRATRASLARQFHFIPNPTPAT